MTRAKLKVNRIHPKQRLRYRFTKAHKRSVTASRETIAPPPAFTE